MVGGADLAVGIAGNAAWNGIASFCRRLTGHQIKIVSPRTSETLRNPERLSGLIAYPVRGNLKSMPKGHEIWLLVQDEINGQIWPQGFSLVHFDPATGVWEGKVNGEGKRIKIIAVVAPPTSQDLFRYFQRIGDARGVHQPLDRIPPECSNLASVQAYLP